MMLSGGGGSAIKIESEISAAEAIHSNPEARKKMKEAIAAVAASRI